MKSKPLPVALQAQIHLLLGRLTEAGVTTTQIGIVLKLRALCELRGYLPENLLAMSTLAGVSMLDLTAVWPKVRGEFVERNGRLYHPEIRRARVVERLRVRRWQRVGRLGGRPRLTPRAVCTANQSGSPRKNLKVPAQKPLGFGLENLKVPAPASRSLDLDLSTNTLCTASRESTPRAQKPRAREAFNGRRLRVPIFLDRDFRSWLNGTLFDLPGFYAGLDAELVRNGHPYDLRWIRERFREAMPKPPRLTQDERSGGAAIDAPISAQERSQARSTRRAWGYCRHETRCESEQACIAEIVVGWRWTEREILDRAGSYYREMRDEHPRPSDLADTSALCAH